MKQLIFYTILTLLICGYTAYCLGESLSAFLNTGQWAAGANLLWDVGMIIICIHVSIKMTKVWKNRKI